MRTAKTASVTPWSDVRLKNKVKSKCTFNIQRLFLRHHLLLFDLRRSTWYNGMVYAAIICHIWLMFFEPATMSKLRRVIFFAISQWNENFLPDYWAWYVTQGLRLDYLVGIVLLGRRVVWHHANDVRQFQAPIEETKWSVALLRLHCVCLHDYHRLFPTNFHKRFFL